MVVYSRSQSYRNFETRLTILYCILFLKKERNTYTVVKLEKRHLLDSSAPHDSHSSILASLNRVLFFGGPRAPFLAGVLANLLIRGPFVCNANASLGPCA
jgi:hypothetical protein